MCLKWIISFSFLFPMAVFSAPSGSAEQNTISNKEVKEKLEKKESDSAPAKKTHTEAAATKKQAKTKSDVVAKPNSEALLKKDTQKGGNLRGAPLKTGAQPDWEKNLPKGVRFVIADHAVPFEGAPKVYKYVFENGLRLLVIPDERNTLVTIRSMLDAGSDRETIEIAGLAHFLEHMMFPKTAGYDAGYFEKMISGLGGSSNAGTANVFVKYQSDIPGPALIDKGFLEFEIKKLRFPEIMDPYFTTEKGAVLSELKMRMENDPTERGFAVLSAVTEKGTPREWQTIGYPYVIENMTTKTMEHFHKTLYVPNNTVLVVAGAVGSISEIVNLVYKYTHDWKMEPLPSQAKLPVDYFERDKGKLYECSENVSLKYYNLVLNRKRPLKTYEDLVVFSFFKVILDDLYEEGSFQRALQKRDIANSFGLFQFFREGVVTDIIRLQLSPSQTLEKFREFWDASIKKIMTYKIDARVKKIFYKMADMNNANVLDSITSLADDALFKEFLLRDPFVDKNENEIIKKLTEKGFRLWIENNLKFRDAYVIGVVPEQEGVTSCNDFGKPVKGVQK